MLSTDISILILFSFPGGSVVKNPPANAGDTGSIPGSGRCPRRGNGNPLQYSCLGNPMDSGAWQGHSPWGIIKEADTTLTTTTKPLLSRGHFLTCSLILAESGAQSSSKGDTLRTPSPWTFFSLCLQPPAHWRAHGWCPGSLGELWPSGAGTPAWPSTATWGSTGAANCNIRSRNSKLSLPTENSFPLVFLPKLIWFPTGQVTP